MGKDVSGGKRSKFIKSDKMMRKDVLGAGAVKISKNPKK